MAGDTSDIDFKTLRLLMRIALLCGAGVLVLALWALGQFREFAVGWTVMAIAFGVIAWSMVFYFGCLATAGTMTDYIVSDDTEIKGDNVEMVTTTRSSGDKRLDGWIGTFVFARNTFGLAVLPVLILIGLYIWG